MYPFNRRRFLQLAGVTTAIAGLLEQAVIRQGDRYGQILAQSTPRKRALLVGVNQYPNSSRFTPLRGCTTDVQLQRELLIHRFGFHRDDILILSDDTDHQPTRANILSAFEEHLIKPTREEDVVVFHFSGHGSRVIEPNSPDGDDVNSTFVPADAANDTDVVNDIMGRTLFLLTSALKTEQVSVVLDSCYAGGGTRGNVRVRSAWDGNTYRPSQEETAYQTEWLRELQLPFAELRDRRLRGVATGVVLAAARRDQEAVDVGFDGFYAGAFTYLLTQYLWQQTDSHRGTVARITQDMKALSGQVPLLDAKPNQRFDQAEAFFVPVARQIPPAEAVITHVEGNQATIWLGGIDYESITTFGRGATLTPAGLESLGEVTMVARQGIRGIVTLPAPVPEGTLLQEVSRVIPPDLTLRIGLDPSLGDKALAAQQQLRAIARVEGVLPQPGAVPYEGEIHYILSAMTPVYQQRFVGQTGVPDVGNVGLFTRGLDEWLVGSFVDGELRGDRLISDLTPRLQLLLAARLIKATLKANSARFQIMTSLIAEEIVATPELFNGLRAQGPQALDRGDANTFILPAILFPTRDDGLLPHQIPLNADFRFLIQNQESEALYVGLVAIASDGRFIVLHPAIAASRAAANAGSLMQPGETRLVPSREVGAFFAEELGPGEVLVIASPKPFFAVLKQLTTLTDLQNLMKGHAKETATTENKSTTFSAVNGLLTEIRTGQPDEAASTVVRTAEMSAYSISFEVVET